MLQPGPQAALDFTSQQLGNRRIRIDAKTAVIGGGWSGCEFLVVGDAELAFRDAVLDECRFDTESSHRAAGVSFNACHLKRSLIDGDWRNVQIVSSNTPVRSTRFEFRTVDFYAPGVTFDKCHFTPVVERWQTRHATFRDSFWSPEITREAELPSAQFYGSTVVVGDWTNVCTRKNEINLQTARHIRDEWADLKTEYTGVRLYIILILTVAFLLPYLGKAWVLSLAAGALRDTGVVIKWLPLWQVVIFPPGQTFVEAVLATLLITYNVGRVWLTFFVARLRVRETHLLNSGFTAARPPLSRRRIRMPFLSTPARLSPLLAVHRVLGFLFYVSVISATLRSLAFLLQDVPVF